MPTENRRGTWWVRRDRSHLFSNSKKENKNKRMCKIKRITSEAKRNTAENNHHTTPLVTMTIMALPFVRYK